MALAAPLFTLLVILVLLWLAFRWLRQISRRPSPS